jgi:hypothetical protein
LERRHELVGEIRRLERCVWRLRVQQGVFLGLVGSRAVLDVIQLLS